MFNLGQFLTIGSDSLMNMAHPDAQLPHRFVITQGISPSALPIPAAFGRSSYLNEKKLA
jgi:hypothetical protein